MFKIYFFFLLIFLFFLSSCIDPVNFKFKDQVNHIVVEAKFTNLPGPHVVRLSVSQPFTTSFKEYVKKANVFITSKEGEYIEFSYDPSTYLYTNFSAAGIIGHTYTLHIITPDENVYESEPVTLMPAVPIDSISFKYGEVIAKEKGEGGRPLSGYYINVDYTDPANSKNFYRWSYKATYEVQTQPFDFVDYCCVPPVSRPKPCCIQCWVSENANLIVVRNDRLTDGRKVLSEQLFFLPFEKYMNHKLRLEVQQHSITEDAYDFFTEMEKQRNNTGSVFDPPPTEIKGNISNINDENEQVIGFFDASSVSIKDITIRRLDIPYDIRLFEYPDDCRVLENASTTPPVDW